MRRPRDAVLRMLLTLAAAAAAATNAETSNCSDKCGQVLVQYPFGIEPGCYRDGFAITCDRSDGNSPKAFLGTSDIEVTEISLLHGQSRVKAQVSWECYNETAVESTNTNLPSKSFDVNGVYKISDDRNKFTLIGCNSMAYLQSQQTADGPYPYVYYTGCLSYCEDTSKVINGVCNGIGCCQTSIPSGLSDTSFSFTAYSHRYFLSFSPCSYVFIVDQDYYSFSATDLTMDTNKSMPLWLDWAVRDAATCEEAKGSDNYACRSQNSVCSKARSGAGYLCNCSQGYQGNPYLVDGCQDIDECKLPEKYPCYGVCSNLPGSYHCTCPPGRRGDPFNGPCVLSSLFVTKVVIGVSSALFATLALISAMLITRSKRRHAREKEKLLKEISNGRILSMQMDTLTVFTLQDLQRATDNFHYSRVLGRGGHGVVYRGVLENRREVAIKKTLLTIEAQNGEAMEVRQKEFLNELKILTQINHRNVVRLFGCCLEEKIPLLVYEFVPNGTLSHFIHKRDPNPSVPLDVVLKIAVESAEALAYLHSSTSRAIIHGDVKPSNILLDDKLMAKVSDFGASTLLLTDRTQTVSFVQGTIGYVDPDFLETRRLTAKTDVYSFGVVLLELVTRKKAVLDDASGVRELASMSREELLHILDEQFVREGGMVLLEKVVELALQCLRRRRDERPDMKRVAEKLRKFIRIRQQRRGELYTDEIDTRYLLPDSSIYHSFDRTLMQGMGSRRPSRV
ncbi:wall-associated receptor kinase 2-like [Musa acuminata AAA Group]|uniref:wall-associated receptor kinase 2-like n=1 Tax=Musa acuminata AAA Group TaxID=214697 RepID=UPI0031E23EF0